MVKRGGSGGGPRQCTKRWPKHPDRARLDARAVAELCARFEAEHLARYGHAFSGEFPVEIVNLRLVGTRRPAGIVEPAPFDPASRAGPDTATCRVLRPATGLVETPVIGRGRLGGDPAAGPFVIEEYEGTCVVPPDCTARLDRLGNVIIELPAGCREPVSESARIRTAGAPAPPWSRRPAPGTRAEKAAK